MVSGISGSQKLITVRQSFVIAAVGHIVAHTGQRHEGCAVVIGLVLVVLLFLHLQGPPVFIDTGNADGIVIAGTGDVLYRVYIVGNGICPAGISDIFVPGVVLLGEIPDRAGLVGSPVLTPDPAVAPELRNVIIGVRSESPVCVIDRIQNDDQHQTELPYPGSLSRHKALTEQDHGNKERGHGRKGLDVPRLVKKKDGRVNGKADAHQIDPVLPGKGKQVVPLPDQDIAEKEHIYPAPSVGHIGHAVQKTAAQGEEYDHKACRAQHCRCDSCQHITTPGGSHSTVAGRIEYHMSVRKAES